MKKISLILIFTLLMLSISDTYAYPIYTDKPMIHKSQAIAFARDRKASDAFLKSIDYIYAKKTKVDPSIIVAISCIETGYGKSNLFVNRKNPGGIKSRKGWQYFNTLEEGYDRMFSLIDGYNVSTTEELGRYYWVEDGCDSGYHRQLSIVLEKMKQYPIKEEKKVFKRKRKIDELRQINNDAKDKVKSMYIYYFIKDNRVRRYKLRQELIDVYNMLKEKDDNDNGVDIINDILNKEE